MADELIQVLGFDASQAIRQIGLLGNNLDSLTKRFQTLAATGGGRLKVGPEVDRIGEAVKRTDKNVQNLNKNLATVGKIIKTQFIVRAFSQISGAIRGSINQAVEFQKAVGEINTLTDQVDVADELRVTAETFGFDILDLAGAKYQLLSNQVKDADTNIEAFNASLKLARATNTDATASVDLISSVLNSFGKSAADAEESAGILFKLIEQGRVRASELSSALGTVTPLAARLGVEFEEVAASLAVITRQGVRANVALTQQRGIFNKLLKPSEALKQVFQDIGVQDATQGIQQFGGLIPFLQRINQEAENNISVQAELFNNVRGLAGVLNTFANNGNDVQAVLSELGLTGSEAVATLNEAFRELENTDAVAFEKQLRDLDNALISLGEAALPAAITSLSALNNIIEGFTEIFQTAQTNVNSAGEAVENFSKNVAGASNAATNANKEIARLGVTLFETTFSVQAFRILSNILKDRALIKSAADLQERVKALNEELKDNASAADEVDQGFKELTSSVRAELARVRDANEQTFVEINRLARTFVAEQTSLFKGNLDARKDILRELENAAKQTEQNITDSQDKEADLRQKIANREFQQQIKSFDPLTQSIKTFQRSVETFEGAQELVDTGNLEEAIKQLDIAEKQARDALSLAEGTDNFTAQAQAEQQITDILRGKLTIQELITAQQKAQTDGLEDAVKAERAAVEDIAALTRDLTANFQIIGDTSVSPTQREKAKENVRRLITELQQIAVSDETLDIADVLGITEQTLNAQNFLQGINFDFESAAADLQSQVQALSDDITVQIPVVFQLQEADFIDEINIFDPIGSAEQGVTKLEESQKDASKSTRELTNQQSRLKTALAAVQDQVKQIDGTFIATEDFAGKLQDLFETIISDGSVSLTELESFIGLIRELERLEQIDVPGPTGTGEDNFIQALEDSLKRVVTLSRQVNQTRDALDTPNFRNLLEGSEALDQFLERTRTTFDVIGKQGSISIAAVREEVTLTTGETDRFTSELNSSLSTMQQLLQAAGDLKTTIEQTPAPPVVAEGSQFGGIAGRTFFQSVGGFMRRLASGGNAKYLNSGGFSPRGTDVVPAMLSPGEFVVNARSSRRFASQLIAMNAGVTPQFRQEGGAVDNSVNVGPISIVEAKDPQASAREITAAIRREQRRGASPNPIRRR